MEQNEAALMDSRQQEETERAIPTARCSTTSRLLKSSGSRSEQNLNSAALGKSNNSFHVRFGSDESDHVSPIQQHQHQQRSALFDDSGVMLPVIRETLSPAASDNNDKDFWLPSFQQPSITTTDSEHEGSSVPDDEEISSNVEYDDEPEIPPTANTSSTKQGNSNLLFTVSSLIISCCCYHSPSSDHNNNGRNLVWVQVSLCIVTIFPCFWCLTRLAVETTTDRTIVYRLIFLCGFMTLLQIGQGILFSIVFYARFSTTLGKIYFEPNLWNPASYLMAVAVIGVILLIATLLVTRAIRQVNLPGLVRYYWALRWLLPLELFCAIGLFDFHNVTKVFVKHWFSDISVAWFHVRFCMQPPCDVEEVQHNLSRTLRIVFICNFVLGMTISFLLFLIMQLLENIVSSPVIRRSKERNMPAWLLLPLAGSAWAGWTLLFAQQSSMFILQQNKVKWIGVMYLAVSGAFSIAALFAIYIGLAPVLNPGDKKRKQLAIYIFVFCMVIASLACIAVFSTSLLYSSSIVDISIPSAVFNNFHCLLHSRRCCANNVILTTTLACPDWTKEDFRVVLLTQLKQSAALAAIFFLYAFSALRFGFTLQKQISRYQIDYV